MVKVEIFAADATLRANLNAFFAQGNEYVDSCSAYMRIAQEGRNYSPTVPVIVVYYDTPGSTVPIDSSKPYESNQVETDAFKAYMKQQGVTHGIPK